MAWVSVRITGQDRRNVYIDGHYDEAAGKKAPGPFLVTSGKHTFETLNPQNQVDSRAIVTLKRGQVTAEAEFEDVDPPEDVD
jgi:hypothetical protein